MRTFGLFEAKQKLFELVDRASEGERIGITRRGKLSAVIISVSLEDVFHEIERLRRRARRPKRFNSKELIQEGRI